MSTKPATKSASPAVPSVVPPVESDFEVPAGAEALGAQMKTSDGIELPYPVLYGQAHNGNAQMEELGGIRYFGGWLFEQAKADDFFAAQGLAVPPNFKVEKIKPKDGKPYDAYTVRNLPLAVIAKRFSWLNETTRQRAPQYFEGARRHLQLVALLGTANLATKKFDPLFPAVLTVKGYQAEEVYAAFTVWDKATAEMRRALVGAGKPVPPANLFYMALGTHGEKYVEKSVGKNKTSPITPFTVTVPEKDKLDKAYLLARYVGKDTATQMTDWLSQAQEWLGVWSKAVNEAETNGAPVTEADDFGAPPTGEASLPF